MKRILILISSTCYLLSSIYASIPTGYYDSANGKTGDSICAALFSIISEHTDVGYDSLYSVYPTSDVKEGTTNQVWDIYSTCSWTHGQKKCGNYKGVCDCYNREHTVPQSWFGEASPMVSDAFHVMPTDGRVNGQRSNYPYGECNNGTSLGGKALGKLGTSSFGGYTSIGDVFEPDDEYKGDVARNYFYMVTCYRDKNFTQSSEGKVMFTYSGGKAAFTAYSIALLLKWHRNDPVSQKEIDRNNAIYAHQHNRNPFIDYPCLAEYIWGVYSTETLDLSQIMSSEDPKFFDPEYTSGCVCNTNLPTLALPKQSSTIEVGSASVGDSVTMGIPVFGVNLTQPLTCTLSGANASLFLLNKYTVSAAEALAGDTLWVSYRPTALGNHTATLTLSSSELSTSREVTLTGVSKAELVTPVTGFNLAFLAYGVNNVISQQVYVKTTNIQSDLYIGIASSGTACFSVLPTSLTAAQANQGAFITVTYSPTKIGELSTNLIINSTGREFAQPTLSLHGACVFQVQEPTDITSSSATLHWTNADKDSYIVDVFQLSHQELDSVIILDDAKGGSATKVNTYFDQDEPNAIRLGVKSNLGSLTYNNLDLSKGGTVVVRAKYYGTDESTMQVTMGTSKQTVVLSSSYQDYEFAVPSGLSQKSTVKIEMIAAKKRIYVMNVKVFTGGTQEVRTRVSGYPMLATGDLSHVVLGLLPDTEYSYTIKPDGLEASDIQTFTTASPTTDLPEMINHQSSITNPPTSKFLTPSGQLRLIHNGRTYSPTGALLSK